MNLSGTNTTVSPLEWQAETNMGSSPSNPIIQPEEEWNKNPLCIMCFSIMLEIEWRPNDLYSRCIALLSFMFYYITSLLLT
jgi:hypothetical protein